MPSARLLLVSLVAALGPSAELSTATAAPPAPTPAAVPVPDSSYDETDFAPYFAEGVLKEAKAAFDAGQYAKVRTLTDGVEKTWSVRYLRALAAERLEYTDLSAFEMSELLALENVPGVERIRDRILVHAALAYEAEEQWEKAASLYGQVPSTSKLFVDARFGLHRAARRLEEWDQARAALDAIAGRGAPSWGRNVAAEALLGLADLARDQKDKAAERAALVRLWSDHPLSSLSALAEKRLNGQLSLDSIVTRGEQLIELHRNEQGMAVLAPHLPTLKLPDATACRAHFAYGKALRKQREHTRAIAALTPVVEQCKDPELRPKALYVLGSSRSIVDLQFGPGIYETLAREYPEHSYADDALFFAADIYARTGDTASAHQRLTELADRYPRGDYFAEALFKSFWLLRSDKRLAEATQVLERIERSFANHRDTYEVERAQYWRARMLLDAGKQQEAAVLFERIATEHPVTYYGLISRSRLDELEPERAVALRQVLTVPTPPRQPWPLDAGALEKDPHFLAGVELIRLGFQEAAASELLAARRSGLPSEPRQLLVHALAAAGDTRSAHAIARTELREHLSGPIRADTRPVWEVAYPDAFRPLIEKHSAKVNLDPDLLQALMREESALDPKALSWAGARGLTQLMLSTARAVAKTVPGMKQVTPELLLQPDPNIQLGSAHLASLLRKFDGNKAYAIASYNAGSNAVSRWREQRAELQLDEWVEEIPIAETRGYVKRVLRTYNTYQLLYARGVPTVLPPKNTDG